MRSRLADIYDNADRCHSEASTVASWLKIDGCGCMYWSDVNSDHGRPTSHRICYAMSQSYKKITRQWPNWQENNGTVVLSTEKSNGHFANSIGLWPMSDVDVHPWNNTNNHINNIYIEYKHFHFLQYSIYYSCLWWFCFWFWFCFYASWYHICLFWVGVCNEGHRWQSICLQNILSSSIWSNKR